MAYFRIAREDADHLMVNKSVVRLSVRGVILEGRLAYRRLRRHWKTYLLQCGLSALVLLIVMLIVDVVLQAAIAVAIASTAFIVFVMPHSKAAAPRRVVGGHVVAVIVSTALSVLHLIPVFGEQAAESHVAGDLLAVLSVGLSIFLMVLTRTEHPPAAGTALGLVVGGWALSAVLFVLFGAVTLSIVHMFTRRRLTNLF